MTYDSRTETDERQLFCHAVLCAVPCRVRPSRPCFPGLVPVQGSQLVSHQVADGDAAGNGRRSRPCHSVHSAQLAADHNHIHIEVKGLRTPVNNLEEVSKDDGNQDDDGFAAQQATYVRLTCTAR